MKYLLIICLIIASCIGLNAQGIKFEEINLEKAIELAKKENKKIFIDVYTEWCGPCKGMTMNVFPVKEVGDFFNEKFISVKIDAEKGKGIEISKEFEVKAFPTFLFLNNEGKLEKKYVGAKSVIDFLKIGHEVYGLKLDTKEFDDLKKSMAKAYVEMDYKSIDKLFDDFMNSLKGNKVAIAMVGSGLVECFLNSDKISDLELGMKVREKLVKHYGQQSIGNKTTGAKLLIKLERRSEANKLLKSVLDDMEKDGMLNSFETIASGVKKMMETGEFEMNQNSMNYTQSFLLGKRTSPK